MQQTIFDTVQNANHNIMKVNIIVTKPRKNKLLSKFLAQM